MRFFLIQMGFFLIQMSPDLSHSQAGIQQSHTRKDWASLERLFSHLVPPQNVTQSDEFRVMPPMKRSN